MAAGQVNRIVHHLRWIAQGPDGRAGTDGQLLERFVGRRDDLAFEELVRRHGPMVLGVCQRVLGNAHDAEDAFQATFMVLVRKARSVVPRELVGNWLYGVACRVALDAQGRANRRRAREKQVVDMPHPTTAAPADADLRPVLDLELSRLAEKYRVPIVLCDLEGRSRKDVARQLGVPEGTLSSRLATGRKQLAARLTRRGLALGAAGLAAALADGAAQAAVPGTLAISTVQAAATGATAQAVALGLLSARAAALTEGVMKAMLISKLKTLAAVVVTLGLLTTGTGVMTLTADEPSSGGPPVQARPAGPNAAARVSAPADMMYLLFDPKTGKVMHQKEMAFDLDWDNDALQLSQRPDAKAQPPGGGPLPLWMLLHGDKGKAEAGVEFGGLRFLIQKEKVEGGIPATVRAGDDVILVIRVPRKGTPKSDAEFLRRVCMDIAKRHPTPLEMHYFLKDADPQKYVAAIERLVGGSAPPVVPHVKAMWKVVAPPAKESAAEAYVKEKLGKKELTADERRLVQQVLEFARQGQPHAAPAGDGTLRLWFDGTPKKK